MLMDAYGREGGVKNPKNHAYVIYGCPLLEIGQSRQIRPLDITKIFFLTFGGFSRGPLSH